MGHDVRLVVERARKGDREAFASLVRTHQRRVYLIAVRMMGNHDDASDVAQEAFIRAYHGLPSFDGRSDFFTWLYRIAVNVCLNHLRRTRRQRTVPLEEVVLPEALEQQVGEDPRRRLELKQMMLDIDQALDELSPVLRATLVLVVLEGMPYREVSEILECSEGTVAWRIHEAREKLRGRLGMYLAAGQVPENKNGLSGDKREAVSARR